MYATMEALQPDADGPRDLSSLLLYLSFVVSCSADVKLFNYMHHFIGLRYDLTDNLSCVICCVDRPVVFGWVLNRLSRCRRRTKVRYLAVRLLVIESIGEVCLQPEVCACDGNVDRTVFVHLIMPVRTFP